MRDTRRPMLEPAGPGHQAVRRYLAVKHGRAEDGGRDRSVAVEGLWPTKIALDAAVPVEAVFVCPAMLRGPEIEGAVERAIGTGAVAHEVSERVLRRMVDRDGPDGVAALCRVRRWELSDLSPSSTTRLAVVDAWDLPGNLGSMIRAADGAGAAAVIASEPRIRVDHPTVLRASMGTALVHPVVCATRADTIRWLRRNRVRIVAADPAAPTSYRDADYRGPVAVVVGSERHGLDPVWRSEADVTVAIPMAGTADSLNAAIAGALLLYEAMARSDEPA